jgi:hypothetical protein
MSVFWAEAAEDEPTWYVSEVRAGYEVRGISVYADGRCAWADIEHESDERFLSPELVPTPDELNQDPQFVASAIALHDFERVWDWARTGSGPRPEAVSARLVDPDSPITGTPGRG